MPNPLLLLYLTLICTLKRLLANNGLCAYIKSMWFYKFNLLLLTLFLLGGTAMMSRGQDDRPPLSPAEFHEQECRRIQQGLEDYSTTTERSTQADFDVTYYDLQFDFRNYTARVIYGSTTIVAKSLAPDLDQFVLDLCTNLIVDSVVCGGNQQSFNHTANTLTAFLDRTYIENETCSATIYYHGTPCNTNIYQSFSWYSRLVGVTVIPAIHTLSEPYGARDWWPSKNIPSDKADSARISITVADTLTGVSNGVLESVTPLPPSSATYTWFEKHPIASYLICANATNYRRYQDWFITQANDSIPIDNYVYPERYNLALASWNVLPAMMAFCTEMYGEYPFADEKYGHTMFNFSGAMEHQCNTSFGRSVTTGQHNYDYLSMHELAHQWWGDEVTLETWPDVWLNEGFACFSEAIWFEHLSGIDAYRNYMNNNLTVTDPSGPVYNPSALFSSNSVYHKGAWILHILRGVVRNDSLFYSMFPLYRSLYAYSNATTEEFLAAASTAYGFDVTPYLYSYLYKTNRPNFEVSYDSGYLDGDTVTVVRIRQTQTDPDTTFRTILDFAFSGTHDTTLTEENSQREEFYRYALGFSPTTLTIDPENWVLKQVTVAQLPPKILNSALDSALVGFPYSDTLVAIGGTHAYAWSLLSGDLPLGLTLSEDGILSGIPETYGSFQFSVLAVDSAEASDSAWLAIEITRPPVPTPWNLTARRIASNSLELRWGGSSPADSFRIYRSTLGDMSDTVLIATVAEKRYIDSILPDSSTSGNARFYFVIAIQNP